MDYLDHQRLHAVNLFRPQFSYIFDYTGELQVNCILRFENLESEFAEKVSPVLGVARRLPLSNRSAGGDDYRQYYDPELAEKIRVLYSEDVVRFAYKFE